MQDQNTTETVESVTKEFIQSVEQEPAAVLVHISAPDLTIPPEVDPDLHKEAKQAAQDAREQEEATCTEDDPRREVDQSENPLSADEINEELGMERAHLAQSLANTLQYTRSLEAQIAELRTNIVKAMGVPPEYPRTPVEKINPHTTMPINEAFDIEEAINDSDAPVSEGSKALSDDEAMDEMAAPGAKLDLNADFVESLEELVAAVDAGSMLAIPAKELAIPAAILMLCREVRDLRTDLMSTVRITREADLDEDFNDDI